MAVLGGRLNERGLQNDVCSEMYVESLHSHSQLTGSLFSRRVAPAAAQTGADYALATTAAPPPVAPRSRALSRVRIRAPRGRADPTARQTHTPQSRERDTPSPYRHRRLRQRTRPCDAPPRLSCASTAPHATQRRRTRPPGCQCHACTLLPPHRPPSHAPSPVFWLRLRIHAHSSCSV